MNKMLGAIMGLHRNRKKGFTLIELIVVIVIIAILVAALTPAILGVIRRANEAADQADARTIMMAASVAELTKTGAANITNADIRAQISGGIPSAVTSYTVYMSDGMCVRVDVNGRSAGTVTVPDGAASGTSLGPFTP